VILCVYALTGAVARLSAKGVSGERLHLIREGRIAAVVGQVARAWRPTHVNLRLYDRTVRDLAASLPALLPARFGTCFDDPEELRFVLRSRGRSLGHALAHVRNRAQMTVRIVDLPERVAGMPARSVEAMQPPTRPGIAYLRRRAAVAAADRDVAGFEPVRAAVKRWLRDERTERRGRIATVYHLIPRASGEAYRKAITRASADAGLHVTVSGPWPAYAFADTW
jgi:hypothetical protein